MSIFRRIRRLFVPGQPTWIARADVPPVVPVFPLSDVVLFPGGVLKPLRVARSSLVAVVDSVLVGDGLVLAVAQRVPDRIRPGAIDLFGTGCLARIVDCATPQGSACRDVGLQGLARCRITRFASDRPYLAAWVDPQESTNGDDPSVAAGGEALRALALEAVSRLSDHQEQARALIESIKVHDHLCDLVIANYGVPLAEKQRALEMNDVPARIALARELIGELLRRTPKPA